MIVEQQTKKLSFDITTVNDILKCMKEENCDLKLK